MTRERARWAERRLWAIDATGREFALTIAVGEPYRVDGGDWACSVATEGLFDRLPDIHGVDSWQALQLALRLVASLLTGCATDGGRLFGFEEREPVAPYELFARVTTSP